MAIIFTDLLQKGIDRGIVPAKTQEARDWFREAARNVPARKVSPTRVITQAQVTQGRQKTRIGGMYLFGYDPKTKKDLPYYDTFPLIFPIEPTEDGFLGMNMHYLPLRQRAILMDALFDLTNNQKYDETTRLRLSYNILKSSSKYRLFEPCLKRYLNSHVKTRFVQIPADQWDIALFLPMDRFIKANRTKVYSDSLKRVRTR